MNCILFPKKKEEKTYSRFDMIIKFALSRVSYYFFASFSVYLKCAMN